MHAQPVYETTISSLYDDSEWDEFVLQSPTAPYEQTSLWGNTQRLTGWQAWRLVVRRNGIIVGGVQILEKPVGPFGWKVGYINRGPMLSSSEDGLSPFTLTKIKEHARKRRMLYLAVILPYDGQNLQTDLLANGFAVGVPALPPSTSMMSTLILDLTCDEEAIMAQMRAKTRQNIRKAFKCGFTFRKGTENDLDTFKSLLKTLCSRRKVQSNVPLNNFVNELWVNFSKKNMLHLFILEKAQQPVAAILIFTSGAWARAWRYGWSGELTDEHPNELLYWETIKWAKAHGYRSFDFVGFDTEYARTLLQDPASKSTKQFGASFFKLGFGGKIELLFPKYCYFSNPLLRLIFNRFGTQLMGTRLLKRLTTKNSSET